jgi:hypothetical protein
LGFGIAGTSLSNAAWALAITTILLFIKKDNFLLKFYDQPGIKVTDKLDFLNIIPITVMVLLIIQPLSSHLLSQPKVMLRVFICFMALYYCSKLFYDYLKMLDINECNNSFQSRLPLLIFIVSIFLALIFLGNIISASVYEKFPKLTNLFPYEMPPQLLGTDELVKSVNWQWSNLLGDYREFGAYLYTNMFEFVAYYSVFLIACIACYLLIKKRLVYAKVFTIEDRILLLLLLFSLTLLPVLFIFMNYLVFGSRAWIKSRFL